MRAHRQSRRTLSRHPLVVQLAGTRSCADECAADAVKVTRRAIDKIDRLTKLRRSSGHADQQQRRQCPKGRSSCRQLAYLVASRSAAKPLLAGRTLTLAQLVQVIGTCLDRKSVG